MRLLRLVIRVPTLGQIKVSNDLPGNLRRCLLGNEQVTMGPNEFSIDGGPVNLHKLSDGRVIEALLDSARRAPPDNRIRLHIMGDDGTGADDSTLSDGYSIEDECIRANPYIIANNDTALAKSFRCILPQ